MDGSGLGQAIIVGIIAIAVIAFLVGGVAAIGGWLLVSHLSIGWH